MPLAHLDLHLVNSCHDLWRPVKGICLTHQQTPTVIPWPLSKSVEKWAVGNCVISQHPATPIPMGHRKKARSYRESWIPNLATTEAPGTTRLPGLQWLPHWELCDFSMGIGSCYLIFSCRALHHLATDLSLKTIAVPLSKDHQQE